MSRENLSPLHVMSLIYFTLADIDDDISEDEVAVLIQKLREWAPDDRDTVTNIIGEASEWYLAARDKNVIGDQIIDNLVVFEGFSDQQRRAMLFDLAEIAKADGKFDPKEGKFFEYVASALEIDLNSN